MNTSLHNRNLVIALSVGILVLLIALVLTWVFGGNVGPTLVSPDGAITDGQPSATWKPVPSNAIVPGQGDRNVSADIALPDLVATANPGSTAKFRSFSLSLGKSRFTPNIVAVHMGDTVHLTVSSPDQNADFTQPDFGLRVPIQKSQSKVIEFQATAEGRFTFFCASCGGPDDGPVGYLDVVATE